VEDIQKRLDRRSLHQGRKNDSGNGRRYLGAMRAYVGEEGRHEMFAQNIPNNLETLLDTYNEVAVQKRGEARPVNAQ
jgi:hypothetical protein